MIPFCEGFLTTDHAVVVAPPSYSGIEFGNQTFLTASSHTANYIPQIFPVLFLFLIAGLDDGFET
jgi:hypothetical protein